MFQQQETDLNNLNFKAETNQENMNHNLQNKRIQIQKETREFGRDITYMTAEIINDAQNKTKKIQSKGLGLIQQAKEVVLNQKLHMSLNLKYFH